MFLLNFEENKYFSYLCGAWDLWILAVEANRAVDGSLIQPH